MELIAHCVWLWYGHMVIKVAQYHEIIHHMMRCVVLIIFFSCNCSPCPFPSTEIEMGPLYKTKHKLTNHFCNPTLPCGTANTQLSNINNF